MTPSHLYVGRPACSSIRASSQEAAALTATTKRGNTQAGAPLTTQANAGIETTALATRLSHIAVGTPAPRSVMAATAP
jgi:hypothetical protein